VGATDFSPSEERDPRYPLGIAGSAQGVRAKPFRFLLFRGSFRYDDRCMKREKETSAPVAPVPIATYWSGGHTKHRLLYHLVFIPKYRRRVLNGALAARVRSLFEQACEVNEWHIEELGIQADHLHLMIQVHPRESVASVVKTLKGGSSRVLRIEFPDLEEFLWSSSFWASGYFAETVGQREESVVKRYIQKQREPEPSDDS